MHIILGAPQMEVLKPLIQSPGPGLVIGVDRGAFIAIEEGIGLDVALGDFDSVSSMEKSKVKQSAEEIFSFPADKDDTDAELALMYILENLDAANIYIYNWSGGRIDHLYSLLMIVLQERFLPIVSKINFVSSHNYISYYLAGEYNLNKIKRMEYLSLILLTEVKKLTVTDVSYPLKDEDYILPRALISNKFLNEEATLSFSEGIIAVIQSRD